MVKNKKVGDGVAVKLPVGLGESLSNIHDEEIVAIMLAIYDSLEDLKRHTNALQAAVIAADNFDAFQTAVAVVTVPVATTYLEVEQGLRN